MRLSDTDHARVAGAVARAEANTAGEIVTVLARRSDAYHDAALRWSVLAMLLMLALLASVPGMAEAVHATFEPWDEAPSPRTLMLIALVLATLTFLGARLLLAWRPLRLALTPGRTKTRRVHRQALALFRAGAEKRTTGRTGVLLYVSAEEHRAEIIADAAIHDHVSPECWGEALAPLLAEMRAGRPADGIVAAVERVGAILAERIPSKENDVNELPDRLIEL
ncbi:hypothetical protein NPJ82_03055 [Sphingomonas sp. NY01]|uniref:TPM domain-containing protein n=1 Tax=Sphingomonas sp. NY01 TaxID=2968057 RepID=UPI00315CA0D0